MIHRFAYLKYALALVLVFIGTKIFLHGFIGKIPAVVSLGVTFGLLVGGILLSLLKTRRSEEEPLEIVSQEKREVRVDNVEPRQKHETDV
ncbi:Inner membrane protein alx [compost metagenome]